MTDLAARDLRPPIAVVGADGFVGRAVVHRMLERGHPVIAVDRHVDRRDEGLTAIEIDYADEAHLTEALRGSATAVLLDDRTLGSAVEACRRAQVPRLIVVSTDDSSADKAVASSRDGLDVLVLRPGPLWGPGAPRLLPSVLHAAQLGLRKPLRGRVELTHRDNLVFALVLAEEKFRTVSGSGLGGQQVPIHDGEAVWLERFFEPVVAGLGFQNRGVGLPFGRVHELGAPPRGLAAARASFGYEPLVTAEDGLADCIAHYRAEGWNGKVDRPSLLWWVAILGGLGLVFACGFAPDSPPGSIILPRLPSFMDAHNMRLLAYAAAIGHFLQALRAAVAARKGRTDARGWFIQTLMLGSPSSMALDRRTRGGLGGRANVSTFSAVSFLAPLIVFLVDRYLLAGGGWP